MGRTKLLIQDPDLFKLVFFKIGDNDKEPKSIPTKEGFFLEN